MVAFVDLPPKALTNIITALPPPDIVRLKRVNALLKNLIQDSVEIAYNFNLKTAGLLDSAYCDMPLERKRNFGSLKESNWNFHKIAVDVDFPVIRGALENGVCALTAREVFVGKYKVENIAKDEGEDEPDGEPKIFVSGVQHIPLPTLVHRYDNENDWTYIGLDQPTVGFAESVDENDLFALAAFEPDEENDSLYTIGIVLIRASINRPHDGAKSSILTVGRVPKDYGPPRISLAIAGENLAIAVMARPEGQSDRDSLVIWDWKRGVQKHTQRFRATDLAMTFIREDLLVVCNSIRGSLDFYQIPLSSEIDLNPPEPAASTPSDPLQTTPLYLPPVRVRVISGFALPERNPGWTLSSIGCSSSPAPTPGLTFPKALEKMGKQPFTADPEKAVVVFVIDAQREDDAEDKHTFHMVVHRQALIELLPKEKFTELEEVVGRLKERKRRTGDVADALAAVSLDEGKQEYQTNPYYAFVGWETWGMDVTRWFDTDGFAEALGTIAAGQKYVRFEPEKVAEEVKDEEDGDEEKDGDDEDENDDDEEKDEEADEDAEDEDDDDENDEEGENDGEDDAEDEKEPEAGEKEVAQPSKGKLHIIDFNPYNVKRAWQGFGRPGPFAGPDCTITIIGRMSSLDDTPRVNDDGTTWEHAENVCADHGVFGVPLIGRLSYTSVVGAKSYEFDGAMICEHSVVGYKVQEDTKHTENLTFLYFG